MSDEIKPWGELLNCHAGDHLEQSIAKPMRLVFGGKDIIEQLEDALTRARSGELQGVIICGISEGGSGWIGAHVDDTPYPWSRLLAAVSAAHHDLIVDGTVGWI